VRLSPQAGAEHIRGAHADAKTSPELDSQQLALLDALRRSPEQRASFDELRDAGVELPASIVEELEMIGLPLEWCSLRRSGSSRPGVRLRRAASATDVLARVQPLPEEALPPTPPPPRPSQPSTPPTPQAQPLPQLRPSPADARAAASRLAVRRWVVPAMLIGAFAATVALAVSSASSDRSHSAAPARLAESSAGAERGRLRPGASRARSAHSASDRSAAPRAALAEQHASAALAAQLQARGHELLESGRAQSAALRLSEAIAASGEHVGNCIEPASEACLTYAYALYDLARALAAEGRPAQAASILRQRLRIATQREAVAAELRSVLRRAGAPAAGTPAAGAPAAGAPAAGSPASRAPAARTPAVARSPNRHAPRPRRRSPFAITGGVPAAAA
jgi:hypothetical protein